VEKMKEQYRKGVFFVVYSKTKKGTIQYLLLKRKLHWTGWEFPKGGVEKKEKTFHTVQREIKEETKLIPLKMREFKINGKFEYKEELRDRPGIVGQTFEDLYAVEVKKK
jgi:8-oxo-dGTP pyrophosphatase MutT (NUDIX family)